MSDKLRERKTERSHKTYVGIEKDRRSRNVTLEIPSSFVLALPLTKPASRQSYCSCLSVSF